MELELVCLFQNLQTGARFPSRLVVFIKRYSLSVSQVSPSALCWTRDLLAMGSHWFRASGYSPANAAVTPNAAETTLSLWFPLDTATSNLGSQAVEVTETVPAGAWLLPWVNHLAGLGPKGW